MSYLKSLPEDAVLLHVFKAFPASSKPLLEYHEVLLRGPSPLSVSERELIAAFVSGLNACNYCHGVHEATAREFGINDGLIARLLEDVTAAPVDEALKPILR
jgi:AhpD family alkylhydroperoxidase